jgi:hypothetical protein
MTNQYIILNGEPLVSNGVPTVSVSGPAPTAGMVITAVDGQDAIWATGGGGGGGGSPTGLAGGDLGSSYPNPTVVSVAHVTTGVLPAANQAAQSMGGAVGGTTAASTISLTGNASITGVLPAANQATQPAQTMGGAVGGTTAASTISLTANANITGVLPAANQASQSMGGAVGGTTAASTISLTGNGSITGVLPAANQASQAMGGDVTGTTAAAVVVNIQGNQVLSGALGASQDGYVLTWHNASSQWQALPDVDAGGAQNMSGDVTGTLGANTVAKLQGRTVSSAAPSDGYVLTWNASGSDWVGEAPASGGGNTRGTFAARPAAGHQGNTYYCTDVPFTYFDDGTNWQQYCYGVPCVSPVNAGYSGWTQINITGTESMGTAGDSLWYNSNSADAYLHGWNIGSITTGAGGIFTITMGVIGIKWTTAYSLVGITMSDGTKYVTEGIYRSTGATYPFFGLFQHCYSNSTTRTYATGGTDVTWTQYPPIFWFRVRYDGVNYNFEFSYDKAFWTTYNSSSIGGLSGGGAYLTPTIYGIEFTNENGVPAGTGGATIVSISQTPTNG